MGGRERQPGVLARVGTHDLTSGAAGATWRGNSARVTHTACNGRTVRATRADCPCGAIGLLHFMWRFGPPLILQSCLSLPSPSVLKQHVSNNGT
jgi:hypothetical protein